MNALSEPPGTVIGLGCATFGREIDEPASLALLDYAYEHGVRHFDTAAAYGAGASEKILGRWLASRRPAEVVIATKAVPPFAPSELEASIELSLRRLGHETVDYFYLHRWDASLIDGPLEVLDRACQSGRVRRLGISNLTAVALAGSLARQQELALTRFSVLQCNQNYAVSEMDQAMTNVVNTEGMEVVTFSPLGAGFLTGKHRSGVVPGSRFDLVPGHQAIYFQPAAQRRLERLHAVAADLGHAPERLALAWALRQPGITTVLVGGRTTAHLDQAFAARDFKDRAALAALAETAVNA